MLPLAMALAGLLAGLPPSVEPPEVPGWPVDTPAPVLVPLAGRCVDLAGVDLGPGLYMSDRLAGIVNGRLQALSSMPDRCRVRIEGAIDMTRAESTADFARHEASEDHGLPMLAVLGVVSGSLILGLLGGFGLGQLSK